MNTIDIVIPAKDAMPGLLQCVRYLQKLIIPENWSMQIIVVDDGSKVRLETVSDIQHPPVQIVRHEQNKGRAAAINSGLTTSQAKYCWVLDADCMVVDEHQLVLLASYFDVGVRFYFGRTRSEDSSFWGKYHNNVLDSRNRSTKLQDITTANFGFERRLLVEIGGFSEDYTHYGFEDKDLIANIKNRFGDEAIVLDAKFNCIHDDEPPLSAVLKKFYDAARYSAPVFFDRHENFYDQLGYRKIDYRFAGTLKRPLLSIAAWIPMRFQGLIQWLIKIDIVPFPLKVFFVRVLCASAYYLGSRDARKD